MGGAPQDGWTAIGWFGVAATPKTHPEIRNHYRELRRKIPDELLAKVDEVVTRFTEQYGAEANGMSCLVSKKTHIPFLVCNWEDEMTLGYYESQVQSFLGGEGSTISGGVPQGGDN